MNTPETLRWSRRYCAFCSAFPDAWSDFTVPAVVEHEGTQTHVLDAYPICRACLERPRHVLEAIVAAGFKPTD